MHSLTIDFFDTPDECNLTSSNETRPVWQLKHTRRHKLSKQIRKINMTTQINAYVRVERDLAESYGMDNSYIANLLIRQMREYALTVETATYGKLMEIWDRDCAPVLDEQINEYGYAA